MKLFKQKEWVVQAALYNNMFIYNNITYFNLSYLVHYPEDIQESEGIYYWVYYPNFDPQHSDVNEVQVILENFTKANISLSEVTEQFKFRVEVSEASFPDNNRLFGLSVEKEEKLIYYLKSDRKSVETFHDFFKDACLRRPFYIGKAINLRSRLKQHFTGKSEIIRILSEKKISYNDVWIGVQETNLSSEESLSNVFEEILQRIVKPGLTQRPG